MTDHWKRGEALDPEDRLLWHFPRQRLEFEATRDALLAVAGRLDRTMGGPPVKLTEQPFSTRRTLYGYLDRQDIPGWFATFDFPAPDAACTRRFETMVPQRALFFLNSDFVVEQARHLAARAAEENGHPSPRPSPLAAQREREEKPSVNETIRRLFQQVYQRDPDAEELAGAKQLLASAGAHPFVPPDWQYGYGAYDSATKRVKSFERLAIFLDGSWRGGTDLPDKDKRYLSHNANGGHPGRDDSQAAIRRWVSPIDGTISIEGLLMHNLAEGDGVCGLIVSSSKGELGRWEIQADEARTMVSSLEVKRGDTVDFVVEGRGNTRFDHFLWAPILRCTQSGEAAQAGRVWDARRDFDAASEAWSLEPLTGMQMLAQALLMSNEFLFVD